MACNKPVDRHLSKLLPVRFSEQTLPGTFEYALVGQHEHQWGVRVNEILERNKRNVMAFYELMFNDCKPAEAISRYAGQEYRQHNPHVGDGKQAFIAYFERMAREYPGKHVRFVRCIAESDLVVLHCHQLWPGDANEDWVGIDIFRVNEDGKIVEHWDVLQVVPRESKNANSMF